jgi:large subunit ribosomal protein L30e
MSLTITIQEAVKSNKIVIGYRKTIRFIKVDSPKLIVISNNIPQKSMEEIGHNAKISGIKMEIFSGTSKELGIICGKQFTISALAIRG